MVVILLCLGLGACGLTAAINPRLCWQVLERWKTEGAGRPSQRYLQACRNTGALVTVLAAVWLALAVYGLAAG